MAKFKGSIGYATQVEIKPKIWADRIIEKTYRGDILKNTNLWQPSDGLNDDLNIQNKISIVSDPYAYEHMSNIRYVFWLGAKWKVKEITIARPRLILTIGGVYNES